jgi:hypothetical protein
MSKYVQPTELFDDPTGHDRRDGVRHDAARLGKVSARLIGGSEVTLVNFSNRGLLFESDSRLLIGARASVRLTTTDANLVVTGRVVRSRVKGVVNGALRYDAALALDSELSLTVAEELAAAMPPDAPAAGGRTSPAAPGEAPAGEAAAQSAREPVAAEGAGWPAAAPPPEEDVVVQLYATVPHDLAELRRLANDNQW